MGEFDCGDDIGSIRDLNINNEEQHIEEEVKYAKLGQKNKRF